MRKNKKQENFASQNYSGWYINKMISKVYIPQKKVVILFLLVGILFFNFVSADTECTNNDCSIGISLNVAGNPPGSFSGSIKALADGLIANANISILETEYFTITPTGNYDLTGIPEGIYNLRASADSYLSQTKTNQVIESGITKTVDFELGQTGRIKGNVLDFFTGIGVNNANVTLILYGETLSSSLTNSNGGYEFDDLAPGYYNIIITKTGFSPISKPDVHVLGGQNTTINFWLW